MCWCLAKNIANLFFPFKLVLEKWSTQNISCHCKDDFGLDVTVCPLHDKCKAILHLKMIDIQSIHHNERLDAYKGNKEENTENILV